MGINPYTYNSLQFQAKVNTRDIETPNTVIPFHTNYKYGLKKKKKKKKTCATLL